MKKTFAIILFILFITIVCACAAGDKPNSETVAETTAGTFETTVEVDENYIPDDLPNRSLEGYVFRIHAFERVDGGTPLIPCVYVDTMNGNVLNDAVYEKILTVEERFNCKIVLADSASSTSDEAGVMKKILLSGEDVFDICTMHDITLANFTLDGYFMNIYDFPYLNFDKPWWPSYTVESLSLGKQMYLISNTFTYQGFNMQRVLYFNKDLLIDRGEELPYKYVYDGGWTMDKLYSLSRDVYQDLNGDDKRDAGDLYGFINPTYFYCVLEPFRLEGYKKTNDGKLYYEFDVESYSNVVEKLYELIYNGSGFMSDEKTIHKIFSEGRGMFVYGRCADAITYYSISDTRYGILPMPKLNEAQEEYYSSFTDRPCAVPVTVNRDNLDKLGIVIEALSAEGYRKVYPAYFEITMKVRYADQTEDADMFDIIQKNKILGFSYIYGNTGGPLRVLDALFSPNKGSTDVASWAAKNESAQIKRVEFINEKFAELLDSK